LFALGEEFPPSGIITDLLRRSHPSLETGKYKDITTREQLLEWFEQNRLDDLVAARRQIVWHRKTGFYDWFEWCCANWGTRWNCRDFCARPGETSFDFSFCAAWSPPIPVFDKLAHPIHSASRRTTATHMLRNTNNKGRAAASLATPLIRPYL
jgi:hypothetical protein